MESNQPNEILAEYDEKSSMYNSFTEKLRNLVDDLLKERSIRVHSVNSRTKSRQSLSEKLQKQDTPYTSLAQITDLSGIRVITYFADEVDKISKLIQDEFLIDTINSIDKRMTLDPDRFGYLSFHYVVQVHPTRISLVEYKRYTELKAEIQIRSILQHTWAEIEHDLGYKSASSIPRDVRRRFSRLAGLLELADEEFLNIRNILGKYGKDLPAKLANVPEKVDINRESLFAFIESDDIIKRIYDEIRKEQSIRIIKNVPSNTLDRHVAQLSYFGIHTIAHLKTALLNNYDNVIRFSKAWLSNNASPIIFKSAILTYLEYWLLGPSANIEDILKYLKTFSITFENERQNNADRIYSALSSFRSAP